jgi:hypothetical protein
MTTIGDNSLPASTPESRPRKRRRRTVACTQCRTRKLKCDREYPTCGRCMKSRTPGRCTYEDGFLWQQPKTVASSGLLDRFSSRIALPPPNGLGSASSPDSTTAATLSSRNNLSGGVPDVNRAAGGSTRARFLDTVLDVPNPIVHNQWPRTPEREQSWRNTSHYHESTDFGLASPSQQLDLPNKVIIRGKDTRTRFNGGGIIANLMLQVREVADDIHRGGGVDSCHRSSRS